MIVHITETSGVDHDDAYMDHLFDPSICINGLVLFTEELLLGLESKGYFA